jgi:tetratricopeptide (TPR) repeat protein
MEERTISQPVREEISMKTRNLISALVLLFVSSLLLNTGCQSDQDKAQDTIQSYLLVDMIGAKKEAMQYVAKADKEILEERYKDRKGPELDDSSLEAGRKTLGKHLTVKITESKIDGDKMSVTADVTTPNEDAFKEVFMPKFLEGLKEAKDKKEPTSEEMNAAFQKGFEAVEGADIETETESETFELRKEGEKWLVFTDLKTQQEIEELVNAGKSHSIKGEIEEAQAKLTEAKEKLGERDLEDAQEDIKNLEVSILYDGARKLEREDKYAEAIANYTKIVEINPDWKFPPIKTDKAKEKIAELEAKKAKQEAQAAYREKISLNGVEVKNVYGSKRIVGEVKNDGDKTIDKVALAIKFFDKDGKEIHSDSSSPVFAYGDEAKAFKPGHSKKFTKYATNAPEAWDDKIEVTVQEVEFFEKK